MEYRVHPSTGDRISVVGLGTAYVADLSEREAVEALQCAHDGGINYADLATSNGKTFAYYGAAFADVRREMLYQVHFGANYERGGAYGWTTDLETVKRQVDWMLRTLGTDYIDYGFIHCLDEAADWDAYQKNGVLDYLLEMKKQGVVHHIGLSTHTPALANLVLDSGLVEQLMFSINPAYDYQHGDYAKGSVDERTQLYRRCAAAGIGISVMKPFSGGQLLTAATSPFGRALTDYQCMQYALDKPGVLTVLPGMRNKAEVQRLLGFCEAPAAERDYSALGSWAPRQSAGRCVYCNHCQPCPAGLNVGLINKYYDLAQAGDAMAAEHYAGLEKHAGDCIGCGHCDSRCPFGVDQSARMQTIAATFGR